MFKKKIVIGVDPGLSGGIAILCGNQVPKVYKMPTNTIIKNKKKKRYYDIKKIVDMVKPYESEDVAFAIERQSTRPGEGNVSSHTNGQNYGILQGIGYCMRTRVLIISPKIWKKHFPQLITKTFLKLKNDEKNAKCKYKSIKDKGQKKQYKKEVDKIKRLIKAEAKRRSRELCQEWYPSISDEFIKVSDDGKSDALLIALYTRDNLNELVSND